MRIRRNLFPAVLPTAAPLALPRRISAVVVLVAVALAPFAVTGPAYAQAARQDAFVVLMGADTFAVENITRAADRLEGELTGAALGRIVYTALLGPGATITALRMQAWRPGFTEDQGQVQTVGVTFDGDTAVVEITAPSGAQTQRIASQAGALPYLNPSFGLVEQVALRARALAGDEAAAVGVPLFLLQGGQTMAARVEPLGTDSLTISIGSATMRAGVGEDGLLDGMAVPAQNLRIVRVRGAHVEPVALTRPDYSAPADAPYTAESVRVPTPMGHVLAGTLTRPQAAQPVPAVITISGSGAQDRDSSIPTVHGYRPMREIADALGRSGIAVLRMDDRGYGESGGDFASATSADFARDIAAAVAYLRGRDDIDAARIGLVGHSEGALIAPLLAAADTSLAAIVLIAGPALTGADIIAHQQRYAVERATAIPPQSRDSALTAAQEQLRQLAATQPWLAFFLQHDPLPVARSIRNTPVLILHGATDRQVTEDQAQRLAAAFREGGNSDVTARVFPDVNHLMLRDPDGNPAGYSALRERTLAPEVLATMSGWLRDRLGSTQGKN